MTKLYCSLCEEEIKVNDLYVIHGVDTICAKNCVHYDQWPEKDRAVKE